MERPGGDLGVVSQEQDRPPAESLRGHTGPAMERSATSAPDHWHILQRQIRISYQLFLTVISSTTRCRRRAERNRKRSHMPGKMLRQPSAHRSAASLRLTTRCWPDRSTPPYSGRPAPIAGQAAGGRPLYPSIASTGRLWTRPLKTACAMDWNLSGWPDRTWKSTVRYMSP